MKTHIQHIDIDAIYGIHRHALEQSARAATKVLLDDENIKDKWNSDDFYNDMLMEGTHYIIDRDLIGMDEEELKKLLFTHFMFSLKSHRRKEGHREQLMQEALKLVGWYNAAAIQEVSGARYEAALHLRSAVAALLETAPPELGLICKAFMLQEKKAVSKTAVCRELGLTLYELEKKMSEIEKILKNILDF